MNERELDVEVAEKVMGWRWFHCTAKTGVKRNQFCSEESAETWRAAGWTLTEIESPPPDQFNDASGVLDYSTDISAAMEVLKKFQKDGWMWSLNGSSEGGFWCCLYPPNRGFIEGETVDSEAKAVCLAALETTKVKSQEVSVERVEG